MQFSERNGYSKIRETIQIDSIDHNLKTRLWSLLDIFLYSKYKKPFLLNQTSHNVLDKLIQTYWFSFFKKATDEIPSGNTDKISVLKRIFLTELSWFKIYDFIEFNIRHYPFLDSKDTFISEINKVLIEENSAYQVIHEKITEITSEQEIQSIEDALENTNQYSGIQQHLNQALKLMSDRQKPDYRNSIKESISAVESICKIVTNDEKATLGKALKVIEDRFGLHPALKGSLSQLYGYTSDSDGIRHAMLEESNLSYIDAKFMLVACTNFINYLIEKTKDQN
jgi:hypothetical protein